MNEKEKNDEGTEDAAAADMEIRRLIEERRTTPEEGKQRLKDVSKQIKNASGTKKNEETGRDSKEVLGEFYSKLYGDGIRQE